MRTIACDERHLELAIQTVMHRYQDWLEWKSTTCREMIMRALAGEITKTASQFGRLANSISAEMERKLQ